MVHKKTQITTVGFYALGCPKNVVDSERMLAQIAEAGFVITSDNDHADVVVVNTCGFIAPAKAEAFEIIDHALKCKRKGFVKKVIVAGCLPQRMGRTLQKEIEDIDAVVSLARRDDIADVIKQTLFSEQSVSYLSKPGQQIHDDRARLLITPGHWAYLRISEGCDYGCSFCTIPSIRGRFRSKPLELIIDEARELVSSGVVELNIIAQATTSYGRDLGMKDGLAVLIEKLEEIDKLKWIRLMYLYPAGITRRLVETISAGERVVHYIDVPVQHINDEILKAMHRPDTSQKIQEMIKHLRAAMPDVVLRTTLITGFPGETDEQFEELLEFLEWAQFDALGCFPYYPEEGTAAAKMPQQVPDDVKHERVDKLMLRQQQIAFEKNSKRIGTELLSLVDSMESKKKALGRFYGQAPEVDSICRINKCSAKPGDFVKVEVVDFEGYDLIVEQIKD